MNLLKNDLIKYNNGDIFRILWIDKTKRYLYAICVNKKGVPKQLNYEDIVYDLNEGISEKIKEDIYFEYRDENELTKAEIEGREKAWDIIKDMVNIVNYPYIFSSKHRVKMVKRIIDEKGVSKPTIYNYLKRYWIGGQTKNSLIPKYANSGGLGREKDLKDKKVGRPRKNIDIRGEGVNITKEIKIIFKEVIDKFYYNEDELTLMQVYVLMLRDYFSIEITDNEGVKKLDLDLYSETPTYEQFWYWYDNHRDIEKEIKYRKGKKEYEMNHRPIYNNSMSNIQGPGSLYQIDATIGDIYLVSRYDRSRIVGRPTIYFVIDTYSRMFAGVYVGYESPSWIGAMMALSNAACNKVKFCKEYDIDIKEDDWNIEGIPEAIIGDRGEIEGKSIESLINSFGIDIQNTPPYRPDWKGIVENRFNILSQKYKSITPGTVKKDFKKRGGKDYRLDATLDIQEFTKIIIKCILKYNNSSITNYPMDCEAVKDQVEPIPKKIWNWGIENKTGVLRSVSEEIIKLNLMPVDNARVTKEGIKYKNILYTCKSAESENWFNTARDKGTWKIEISYDPRNMTNVYIKSQNGRAFEVCTIKTCNKEYINKTLAEILELHAAKKELKDRSEKVSLTNEINLSSDIEDIVSEAKEKTKQQVDKSESKSSRIKNIRDNKKIEKALSREEEAFILSKEELLENENDKYDTGEFDEFDEFDEFREEELKILSSLGEDSI